MNTLAYIANTEPLKENGLYCIAFDSVSAERKEKVRRYRFLKDKVLSLGAEVLLRKALTDCWITLPEIRYGFETDGKPFIKGLEGFGFNISHSEDLVMVAVSENRIGCDIEKVTDIDLDIAKKFFFREEYENIAAIPALKERNELFFRYWTLKESFMKVTGLGIRLPLDSFSIILDKNCGISVRQSVDERTYSFEETDFAPGYKCALCVAGEVGKMRVETIDFREILREGAEYNTKIYA